MKSFARNPSQTITVKSYSKMAWRNSVINISKITESVGSICEPISKAEKAELKICHIHPYITENKNINQSKFTK
jgi:hypothetical protein